MSKYPVPTVPASLSNLYKKPKLIFIKKKILHIFFLNSILKLLYFLRNNIRGS